MTVGSPHGDVVDRVSRYVGPWWRCLPVDGSAEGPAVTATLCGFDELAAEVATARWRETRYPRAATRYAPRRDGAVVAVTPGERIGYRYVPVAGRMAVRGDEPEALARAAVRVARELVRAQLVADGWTLLHASAVVRPDGRAVLALGGRGAGKSTVAFTLAAAGAGLLGNDRVFARPADDGGVELAAWPSGAAVGLGLLAALGWNRVASARLATGGTPHPAQDARVTAALLAGRERALVDPGSGRELKAHLRPEDFADWCGLSCASTGRVATVLFPAVVPHARPGPDRAREARVRVSKADFMSGRTEDSYPDIFGLTGGAGAGTPGARAATAAALDRIPRHAVVLGHDPGRNTAFLDRLIAAPGSPASPERGNG